MIQFSHHVHQLEYLAIIQSFDGDTPSRDLVHLVHQDKCDLANLLTPYIPSLVYENVANIPRLITQTKYVCDLFAGLALCIVDAECTEDLEDTSAEFPEDLEDPSADFPEDLEDPPADFLEDLEATSAEFPEDLEYPEVSVNHSAETEILDLANQTRDWSDPHAPATRRSKQWGMECLIA